MYSSVWRTATAVWAVVCAVTMCGCGAAYKESIGKVVIPYQQGMYPTAAAEISEAVASAEKNGKNNKLIFLLEKGSILRTQTQLGESTYALDEADRMFEHLDGKAKIQLSREAYAALTNQAALDYEGYGYDRIMMNVYKATNYLEQGQREDARIEIRRIADSQEKSEQRYQDKIRQDQHEAEKLKNERKVEVDMNRAKQDARFQQGEREIFAEFEDVSNETPLDNLSHKRLYVNPFAEYLQGLFYLYSDAAGDREVGRVALRNAAGMMQNNGYAVADAQFAEQASAAGATPARTFVVFETGMAPSRTEIRIDIPIFIYNIAIHDTSVDYFGIAFPKLNKVGNYLAALDARVGGNTYQTQVMADMDKIVAREFKHDFPAILTRAIIGAVLKAGAGAAVAEATKNEDPLVQVLARGAMVGYQAATNEADLRTWRTLPKQIQIASFPTPADGNIELSVPGGGKLADLKVPPGKSTIIWIRSPSMMAPSVVRYFSLN